MDIIDRYLEAVAAQLPVEDRDDIVAELRDLILSRIEAREEERGRALGDEEKEAILHEIGHPLVVAARYRQGPDSLIGPALFPYWLFGAKAGLIVIGAVQALVLLLRVMTDPADFGQAVAQAFHGFFSGGLTLLGALTLAGAVMEHYGIKPVWLTKWRVGDLPAFGFADPAKWGMAVGSGAKAARDGAKAAAAKASAEPRAWGQGVQTAPAAEALWSLIGGGVFVLWWIGALHIPGLNNFGLRGGDLVVSAAPIWGLLFAPILAWAVAGIAVDATGLIWPHAARLRAFLKIPLAAAGLWLGWRLFQAGHWFTLAQGDQTAPINGGPASVSLEALRAINEAGRGLVDTAMTLSTVLSWVLAALMLGLALDILRQMWRISTMKGC
ncbi:hypothetical protein D8I30_07340 [Brevundimonas naejangsanensis]|uniref:Uncharacterized protein n=1 Tax=Brevundimonas naejangsanensis TaxID=588932 RepID=A0A494RMX6_9CAUL|nr:hypothetical protein [Brevundimonas naejangsanensis]AYG95014.1 hypothetical protein D8I30_07340 [Brevundimonas naejangsanensis]